MSTSLEFNRNDGEDARRPDLDIRFGQIGMVHVRIRTTDTGAILDELTGRVAVAPHFFKRTAVCLDLSALDRVPEVGEMRAVIDVVRRVGMLAVGLAGEPAALEDLAAALNLPLMSSFRAAARSLSPGDAASPAGLAGATLAPPPTPSVSPAASAPSSASVPPAASASPGASATFGASAASVPAAVAAPVDLVRPTLMHHHTVRSGQRIYARNRDLIVTGGVGAGAEVMADGCVHIYGSLRGRALAGARGDVTARMFCQEFSAELVSIAGVFRVFEKIPPDLAGKPVQAWLEGEELHCTRIGA